MIEEIKVSELPEASQINDDDLIMIVQSGTNKKITKENCQFASGDEISVSTTEPSEDEKLWINPNDTPSGSLNPITNTYSVATDKGYSCKYTNDLFAPLKTVRFNGEWLDGIKSSGTGKIQLIVPIYNPSSVIPTLNFTAYAIYTGTEWVSGTNIECNGAGTTWVNLSITPPSSLTANGVFLISLVGTVTIP